MFGLGGSLPSAQGLRHGLMGSVLNDPLNQGVGSFDHRSGGMNPMGTLQAMNDRLEAYARDPMSGPTMGGMGGY